MNRLFIISLILLSDIAICSYTGLSMSIMNNGEMEAVTAQSGISIAIKEQLIKTHINEIGYYPSNLTYKNGKWISPLNEEIVGGTYYDAGNDDGGPAAETHKRPDIPENQNWWYLYYDDNEEESEVGARNQWNKNPDDTWDLFDEGDRDLDKEADVFVTNDRLWTLMPESYYHIGQWEDDQEDLKAELILKNILLHGTDSETSPYAIESGIIRLDIPTTEINNKDYTEIQVTMSDFNMDLSIDITDINFCDNKNENGPVSSSLSIDHIEIPQQHLYITSPKRYGMSDEGIAFEMGMQLKIDEIKLMPNQNPSQTDKNIIIKNLMVAKRFENFDENQIDPNKHHGRDNPDRYNQVGISYLDMQELIQTWVPVGEMQMGDLDGDLDGDGTDDMHGENGFIPDNMPTAAIINIVTGQRPEVNPGSDFRGGTYEPPGNSDPSKTYLSAYIPLIPSTIVIQDFKMNGDSFGPVIMENQRGYLKIEIPGRNYEYSHVELVKESQHYHESPISFVDGSWVTPDGK